MITDISQEILRQNVTRDKEGQFYNDEKVDSSKRYKNYKCIYKTVLKYLKYN